MPVVRLVAVAVAAVALRLVVLFLVLGAAAPEALCTWDCGWYERIARDGYAGSSDPSAQQPWAFFPLFPLSMRGAAWLTGLGPPAAAMLVSSLATVGLIAVGGAYRARTRPGSTPVTFALVVATLPWGFYFETGYSEALYGLLALLVLDAVARDRVGLGCLASGLLTATRPTAVWLLPPLALASFRQAGRERSLAGACRRLAPLALAVSGLAAWMAFLAVRVGDPLAFLHAEAAWGRRGADPLRVLLAPLLAGRGGPEAAYDAAAGLLGLAVACWLAARRLRPDALLLGATILMAASSGIRESLARYVVANPVFLLVLADLAERLGRPWRVLAFVAAAAGEVVLTAFWVRHAHFLV